MSSYILTKRDSLETSDATADFANDEEDHKEEKSIGEERV